VKFTACFTNHDKFVNRIDSRSPPIEFNNSPLYQNLLNLPEFQEYKNNITLKLLDKLLTDPKSNAYWADKSNKGLPDGIKKIINILKDKTKTEAQKISAIENEITIRLNSSPEHRHADRDQALILFTERLQNICGVEQTVAKQKVVKGLSDIFGENSKQVNNYNKSMDAQMDVRSDIKAADDDPEMDKIKLQSIEKFIDCINKIKGKDDSIKNLRQLLIEQLAPLSHSAIQTGQGEIGYRLDKLPPNVSSQKFLDDLCDKIEKFPATKLHHSFDPIAVFKSGINPKDKLQKLEALHHRMEDTETTQLKAANVINIVKKALRPKGPA